MTSRSLGRAARDAAAAILGLGLLAVLAGPLEARKLTVRKMPGSWAEARARAEEGGDERVDRITRARERFDAVPPEARHGHLRFGERQASVLERGDLDVRTGPGRGGGSDTTVIRIAVIRVEFQTDRKGSQTTGDGRFLRENPDSLTYFIDPGPHDDEYFAAHVEAVSRYWSSMTYGGVRFEGTVFPRNNQFGAYLLTDMADYGPRNPDELFSIEGLTNYSRESLITADADPDLVWSDYDVYFVVHAGSDWQNDVFGDTPFDLPTFSIAFSDSDVVVTDEGDTLTTMITYPETSSQDGFLVALNGGIAHEMGHQLGLFDIYNVETFAPTVAFYDVMDSGNLASVFIENPRTQEITEVIGVLPSCPGAWSRWLVTFQLGIDPYRVTGDMPRARLRAIQSRAGPGQLPPNTQKWYRVPISETEYFLVENRVDDLDGRYPDGSFRTALDQDDSTGVVLGPIHADTDEISHNYDLLIDPGVLIWHVDERQALANLSQGRGLNVFYDKRSVTIEEADGIVDIGSPYSFFPLGTDKETYHADNNGFFTPDSRPNSDSNLGTPSGISIANIGARDSTVAMDILLSSQPRGWPVEIGGYGFGETSVTIADVDAMGAEEIAASGQTDAWIFRYEDTDGSGTPDPAGTWPRPGGGLAGEPAYTQTLGDLDGDGALELIASTDSGGIYCWGNDGTPHADADSTGLIASFALPNGLAWSPTPADLDADGTDELYAVTLDGRLRGWDVSTVLTERFPPRALLGSAADSVDILVSTLAIGDLDDDLVLDGIVAFVRSDSVHIQRFDASGRRIQRFGWALPDSLESTERTRVWVGLADLDRQPGINDLEIVLALRTGWITVVRSTGVTVPGWPRQVLAPIAGPPAFGDLDGDGLLEIALTSHAGSVHAFNYNGTQMPGWPVYPRLADHPPSLRPPSPPVIADVDGDGRQDVVAGFADFTVRAIAPDGSEAMGFPILTGAPVVSAPAISDVNGDGRLDLFVQSLDGNVYARILRGLVSPGNPQWPMLGGGPALHGSFEPSRLPTLPSAAAAVFDGPVVVFPNPVRGRHDVFSIRYTLGPKLEAATRVDISLYNVAGEMVREVPGTIFPNTENVVTVPSADLVSGVYICSIRARSGERVETLTGKFAVIR